MDSPDIIHALVLTAAVLTFGAAVTLHLRRMRIGPIAPPPPDDQTVFLFDGGLLIDATPAAEKILSLSHIGSDDLTRLTDVLIRSFPAVWDKLAEARRLGSVTLLSETGDTELGIIAVGPRLRLTLREIAVEAGSVSVDPIAYRALEQEIDTLHAMADHAPLLAWREAPGGEIVWANAAYRRAAGTLGAGEQAGVADRLFSRESLTELLRSRAPRRIALRPAGGGADAAVWYECRAADLGDGAMFTALDIGATVAAESQLRSFTQTLTKTFSHLTTGLAIFDRQRRLTMFNPALTDLTRLPVDFLAGRPTLYSFLDRMRDRRMVPEPRDYGSWQRQIAALEEAAEDGSYSETWSLPDDRTYRVTGRPHPGGALAFLIEDISAEMALTRRFRAELETGQAVIDAFDEAIAVFSPGGQVFMVNQAYQEMWDSDIAETVDLPGVSDLSRAWMERAPSPVWGDIRDFVTHTRDRVAWSGDVTLPAGGQLTCRVAPLAGGSTLVRFSPGTGSLPKPRQIA